MRSASAFLASLAILLSSTYLPSLAQAQYMYLDSNANGIHDAGDRLNPNGTTTTVDIWLNTNVNRDGTTALCNVAPATTMSINSYAFNLAASGGTVTYGNYVNQQAAVFPNPAQLLNPGDGVRYKNGSYGTSYIAAGLYRLATLTITGTGGSPRVDFLDLVIGSSDFTSFGTQCFGQFSDNTYKLDGPNTQGLQGTGDWFGADGLDGAESLNNPPQFSAAATAQAEEGAQVSITATVQDPDAGQRVSISLASRPPFLALVGGEQGASPVSATASGTPGFEDAGTYEVQWVATDDGIPAASTNFTTVLTVQNKDRPPVLSAPSSVDGSASDPISFAVVATDPDGDGVQGLTANGLPPGATLTAGSDVSHGTFTWVPEPDLSGTFVVNFMASNAGGSGQTATTIAVNPPTGPRRPHVDPQLLDLQPGLLNSDRILTRGDDGQLYADLFLVGDASPAALASLGVTVNTKIGRSMTARCPLNLLPTLFEAPNLDAIVEPGSCQLLMDSSMVDVGVSGIRTLPVGPGVVRPLVGRAGAGVIVGMVDTGIDVLHEDFLKISGGTRLVSYWNQTRNDPARFPPPPLSYGTQWLPADIDAGVVNSFAADSIGHGTHVIGIAAGNGEGAGSPCLVGSGTNAYLGVAPEADLCVVKAIAKSDFKKVSVLETRIVDAIKYIFRMAAGPPVRPAVVNVSLGSHWGPHDGRSWLDYFTNGLTGPGKIVVAAAGNDANTGVHASAQLHMGLPQEVATLEVGDYTPGGFATGKYIKLVGWYNNQDTISVKVTTPRGTVVGPADLTSSTLVSTPDGLVQICLGTACYGCPPWGDPCSWDPDVPFVVQITDRGTFGDPIASGTWSLDIGTSHLGSPGIVDIYLVEADLGGANTPLIQFALGADANRTITSPASADSVIAVGAYSTRNCWTHTNGQVFCKSTAPGLGDVTDFSSRGPLRNHIDATKPDLCAPGGVVVSSRSFTSFLSSSIVGDSTQVVLGGKYLALAGTSISAPHVTGAVALMLGRTDTQPDSLWRIATPSRIKDRLRAAARTDSHTGIVPNNAWGAGKLDVRAVLAPVMGLRFTEPRKGTVFTTHWGQASVMADSSTLNNALDSVVVEIAVDGCSYNERVAKLTNIGLAKKSYSFLYAAPESYRTTHAKLRATGYVGPNRVQAISDSAFSFEFGSPPTGVEGQDLPRRFALLPNIPNPFNPATVIRFEIARRGPVTLRVFSIDGRLVRTLIDQPLPPGPYSILWDGGNDQAVPVASGVYFYEVTSGEGRLKRKMTLIK